MRLIIFWCIIFADNYNIQFFQKIVSAIVAVFYLTNNYKSKRNKKVKNFILYMIILITLWRALYARTIQINFFKTHINSVRFSWCSLHRRIYNVLHSRSEYFELSESNFRKYWSRRARRDLVCYSQFLWCNIIWIDACYRHTIENERFYE